MLVLRCQFFLEYLHERLYKYALEYLEASHSENTLAQVVIFFFLPQTLDYLDLFEGQ